MPTDPTPPLTEREVLAKVLTSPNGRALAAMYGPEFTGRTLPSLVAEVLEAAHAALTAQLAQRTEEVEGLRKRIEELETPTLYWDAEDGEYGALDTDGLLEMHEWGAGTVHEIAMAHDLPNEWLVVRLDPKDEDGFITETYTTEAEARAALAAPTEG